MPNVVITRPAEADVTPHIEIIVGEHHYRVYPNGKVEGFPEGAIVINRLAPHFDAVMGEIITAARKLGSWTF